MDGNKLSRSVFTFFSSSKRLVSPFKDASKIKAITRELSFATRDHAQFGTIISSSYSNQNRTLINESGSRTSTNMVIGRDRDRDKIVSLLLDFSNAAGILSVASIVGIGGVGKTTLAQCVYNDERVRNFFDMQLWVSATQEFNVKDVLRRIVASATDEEPLNYEMDQLQQRVFRAIVGKRFLLVLDSVWDQDTLRAKWLELKSLLKVGAQGSKLLLTTRSDTVARMMGTLDPYVINDLENDDSWLLFRHVAITKWHDPGVEAIGKDIAKMCPKVPLVILAIGSLLAGKHTVLEWCSFLKNQLSNFASYGHNVGTLKLSYDHLSVGLKLCVTYCSLFPKGFRFERSRLIHLWIAMGYVQGECTNESLEDVAEGYVLCLLQRGFFYCTERDVYECPDSFRMHHLMHDLVLSIAGFKYKMADSNTDEFDERVRHLSYVSAPKSPWKAPSSLFKIRQLNSFLLPIEQFQETEIMPMHDIFISRVQSLRILRMHGLGIKKLPRSLGKLIHLRYLDFSLNPLRKLPDSITQRVNLYLLDLSECSSLEELPKDIGNLVMLRHLILNYCYSLSYIPKGLQRLRGLKTLGYFVVGKSTKSGSACSLAELNAFDNLKGPLMIDFVYRSKDIVSEAKAANLDRKEKITGLGIRFRGTAIEDEMMLDNLKPGVGLECLRIENYAGQRLPRWMRDGIHCWVPNLVKIYITECKGCVYMCSFGRLPHLRWLTFESCDKVEYIENGCNSNNENTVALVDDHASTPFFPSLVRLNFLNMPQLKGWWSVTDIAQDRLVKWIPAFPKLDSLSMVVVELETVFSMAKLLGGSLRFLYFQGKHAEKESAQRSLIKKPATCATPLKSHLTMLRHLNLLKYLIELVPEDFRGMSSLEFLTVGDCKSVETVPEWIDSLTSLRSLCILGCPKVKSLPREISNLPNLETLILAKCSWELAKRCREPTGEDWPKIRHIPYIRIETADNDKSWPVDRLD